MWNYFIKLYILLWKHFIKLYILLWKHFIKLYIYCCETILQNYIYIVAISWNICEIICIVAKPFHNIYIALEPFHKFLNFCHEILWLDTWIRGYLDTWMYYFKLCRICIHFCWNVLWYFKKWFCNVSKCIILWNGFTTIYLSIKFIKWFKAMYTYVIGWFHNNTSKYKFYKMVLQQYIHILWDGSTTIYVYIVGGFHNNMSKYKFYKMVSQ